MKRRSPQSSPSSRKKPAPAMSPGLVTIEKPIYGGAFLARDQGKAVFVPLALPGEQVRVQIAEEKRSFATAEVADIIMPAAERAVPTCSHFAACGGCHYQHATYEAQLDFKQSILRETLERGGVRPPDAIDTLSALPWAYRNRIRLAFDSAGNCGYRGRRSHAIVPIAECPIAAPMLTRAALAAGETVRHLPREQRPSELSLFCNADESLLLAALSVAGPAKFPFETFCRAISGQIPQLVGAELATEGRPDRQPRRLAQWGAPSLDYHVAGFDYRVDQGAFFQINRWLLDALVHRVIGDTSGALAWDLFAGVGLFARQLASRFMRVLAVESAPAAIPALTHNLAGTGAEAIRASTFDFLRRAHGERPDLIVLDPPRTGLGAETTALLAQVASPALVYVSCDPATLARDLRPLLAAGYAIQEITLADLFPQTFHIESIVHLGR
jgi:23S rRNA (uracil1939-C5)-methyltransferase